MIQVAPVDWTPAVAVAIAGIVAGAFLAVRAFRQKSRSTAVPREALDVADLSVRRDALIEQLQGPDLDETERRAVELEMARVLRALDQKAAPSPPAVADVESKPALAEAQASSVRGFLWGAGTVGALALVVFFVQRSAEPRAPDGSLTGAIGTPGAPMQGQGQDQELAALQAAVQRNPNDLNARLELARAFLVRDRLMEVFEQTQYVLERQPDHPSALSYQALVRMAMGQSDVAIEMLKKAIALDPQALESRVHLALVYANMGDNAGAQAAIREAARLHPEESQRLEQLLVQLQAPPGPATATSPAPSSSPSAPGGRVGLVLDLASGRSVAPGSILFVMARAEGLTEGAPIAVKRLAVTSFPMELTIGSEDAMIAGGMLPEKMRIDARIDSDGNPLTRNASDPSGNIESVALGSSGVRLVLR